MPDSGLPKIAIVSRELHPLGGGGIGVAVTGTANALSEVAEVTVLTTSLHEPAYRRLSGSGSTGLDDRIRVAFVPEPGDEDVGSFYGHHHVYSARVLERLRELYSGGAPDLVEVPDYVGEGMVTLQARRGGDPLLRRAKVCVRLHTTIEICAVLDGYLDSSLGMRMVFAAERYCLRYADALLAPAREVISTYARFYGGAALAAAVPVRSSIPSQSVPREPASPPAGGPLRLVYVGRLERRKGVQALIHAVSSLRTDDLRLTVVGGDTPTAPLGTSMRAQLELMAAGDPRIEFVDHLPYDALQRRIAGHHILVCPSLWECWPSVALEGLAAGRPALGTPTGGLVEMLADPGAGWLSGGRDAESLAQAIERRLERRDEVDELIASGEPRRAFERLTDPGELRAGYSRLVGDGQEPARPRVRPRPATQPLVSVVVPYFRLERFLEATLESVLAQDHRELEVIVVNDGSFRPEDDFLRGLASRYQVRVLSQQNRGLGGARNAGIRQSTGRYLLPLDADNMIRPEFVSRCVELLEEDRALAYVSTWSQYVDEAGRPLEGPARGYQPIGNFPDIVHEQNIAGDAAAVIRRRVFDLGFWYSQELTSYEDWQLYRRLHAAGLHGTVIPERLLLYRVRRASLLRGVGLRQEDRLHGEMAADLKERQMEWESRSA